MRKKSSDELMMESFLKGYYLIGESDNSGPVSTGGPLGGGGGSNKGSSYAGSDDEDIDDDEYANLMDVLEQLHSGDITTEEAKDEIISLYFDSHDEDAENKSKHSGAAATKRTEEFKKKNFTKGEMGKKNVPRNSQAKFDKERTTGGKAKPNVHRGSKSTQQYIPGVKHQPDPKGQMGR